jgi:1-acyl-sn-glycerol-3-phosphate acyltransferase
VFAYESLLKITGYTVVGSTKVLLRHALGIIDQGFTDEIYDSWQRDVLAAGECTVAAEGRDHVAPGQPYVVMSNHQSLIDIPAMLACFPGRLRFVSKEELGRIPLWGSAMKATGIVFIDRSDRQGSIAALELAKKQLAAGTSVWIAPEGTRSRTREVGVFKKGGFHMAKQLGLPILPAFIHGTGLLLPPGTLRMPQGGEVKVRFGAPLLPIDNESVEDLRDRTRNAIIDLQPR